MFGWLYDRASPKAVLLTRSLANVASSILYWVAPTFAGFLGGKVCDRIGAAAFRPDWAAMMAEISAGDQSKRARIIGLMSAGEDAGTVTGPILAGLIWDAWGMTALLGTRIVLAVMAELYMLSVIRVSNRPTLPVGQVELEPTAMGSDRGPVTKGGENQPSCRPPRFPGPPS